MHILVFASHELSHLVTQIHHYPHFTVELSEIWLLSSANIKLCVIKPSVL